MNIFDALILGVIQGLTEFLPVSSSGHLVLAQELLNVNPPGALIEIVLHSGTLFSILVFYRLEIWQLITGLLKRQQDELTLLTNIFIGTLPAVIGGLLLKPYLEVFFTGSFFTGVFLCITGCILFLQKSREPNDNPIHYRTALMIGLAQMIAILPGISRSGMTITAAILLGVSGAAAFRFSFFLALPVIAGAAILSLSDVQQIDRQLVLSLIPGCLAAAITGFAALKILFSLVIEQKMWRFSFYCWAIGLTGMYIGL